MNRAWAAMLFGAVGLTMILFAVEVLTGEQSGFRTFPSESIGATTILCQLVVPTILILGGIRLLLRPPILYRADTPEVPISQKWPEIIIEGGFRVVGALAAATHGASLAHVASVKYLIEDIRPATADAITWRTILSTTIGFALGMYLFVGAPKMRTWMARRLKASAPSLAEQCLAAGLTVIGAFLVTHYIRSFLFRLFYLVGRPFFWQDFVQDFIAPAVAVVLGLYLLTGAKALRRIQLRMPAAATDAAPEEPAE